MSAHSMQKAVPTLLAVLVFAMMATVDTRPATALADASQEPTPYSADHARIADTGTQDAAPTF